MPGCSIPRKYVISNQCTPKTSTRPIVRLPCEPPIPRAHRYERKGIFPFLELPGELKNQIYHLAIDRDDYKLGWIDNSHKSKSLTYRRPMYSTSNGPILPKDAAQCRRSLDIDRKPKAIRQHLPQDYYGPIPTSLLLINKQMHDEAAGVFYSKSTFHFHGLGALRHFLDNLTPVAMKSITSLALRYRAYGNPQFTSQRIWKAKHDRLWTDLCWRVADECSLKNLMLDMTLNISPIMFCSLDEAASRGIGAGWMRPLWAFQDINIQRCWVRLRCPSKDDSVLEVESWKLRKEILGNRWDDEAENQRDAYGYSSGQRVADKMLKNRMVSQVINNTTGDGNRQNVTSRRENGVKGGARGFTIFSLP